MSEQLVVAVSGNATAEIPLERRPMRIGSDPQCEARIDNSEVAPLAAMVDFRGGNYLVQNRSAFVVYVDSSPVEPDAWLAWPAQTTLHLTRNVTLTLKSSAPPKTEGTKRSNQKPKAGAASSSVVDEEAPADDSSKAMKTWLQIGVIAICALGCLLILAKGQPTPVAETHDSFASLSAELAQKAKPSFEDDSLLRCLQESWLLDRRPGRDASSTIRAYQVLLSHPLVRAASADGTSVESRIKAFAIARLSALQGSL